MRLKNILENIEVINKKNYKNYNIKSITHISKDVIKDSMFICLKGENFDGNKFVNDAIKNGAKCIITEDESLIADVTIVVVKNTRIAMSIIAKNFYNRACEDLNIIGVIGTCGKTTTCHIISELLSNNDDYIGNIGTNGIYIGKNRLNNNFTTPDPLELHYIFYRMKLLGVKTVVMEVSAQAISLYKMYGIKLKIGVFTNISNEHLDFFKTMENYARCKMDYFNKINMDECVVNIDDFYGRELAYKVTIPCISYGINSPANSFALNIKSDFDGLSFFANILDDVIEVKTKMLGAYNTYNLLAGMTVAKMLGKTVQDIFYKINNLSIIPGRFNVYSFDGKMIVVDFAHTPDSIEKLLSCVKCFSKGKIITIFGCVGYSDKEKRIDMAKAVDKYSDNIIITTDNRGNTPYKDIVKDIIGGIKGENYMCIEDRRSSIIFGYNLLMKDDILVVLGKGAEDFQKIGDEKIPYSDIDCVEELLNKG